MSECAKQTGPPTATPSRSTAAAAASGAADLADECAVSAIARGMGAHVANLRVQEHACQALLGLLPCADTKEWQGITCGQTRQALVAKFTSLASRGAIAAPRRRRRSWRGGTAGPGAAPTGGSAGATGVRSRWSMLRRPCVWCRNGAAGGCRWRLLVMLPAGVSLALAGLPRGLLSVVGNAAHFGACRA